MADTETGVLSAEYTDGGKKGGHVYDPALPSHLLRQGRTADMLEEVFARVEASMLSEDKGAALELAAKAISKAFRIDFEIALESCALATHVCMGADEPPVGTLEELRRKWTGKPEPNRDDYDSGLREADAEVRQLRQKQLATAELFIEAKLVKPEPIPQLARGADIFLARALGWSESSQYTDMLEGVRRLVSGESLVSVSRKEQEQKASLADQLGCAPGWGHIRRAIVSLQAEVESTSGLRELIEYLEMKPGDMAEVISMTWGLSLGGAVSAELKVKRRAG